ncbi:polyprenol monophosphomannose synthase [Kallotenue papyrolyticum]|uniref:polyprenol monophosphomannose synthase n=1 Tax=Kallotenue papyrolyticum TaxID=1325125 RepID=UPI0004923657|nr:polyprenol monophosphomannose synthase [Kallotenue papyrolyticum]
MIALDAPARPSVVTDRRSITTPGLVIVPTYNEAENINNLLPQILDDTRLSVLVVDDGSPDGTGQLVATQAAHNPRIHLIQRSGKQGLGTAYIAGFRYALERGAQYIFEMDADFSHDPRYLPDLLHAAETTYDLVIGSRYIPGGGTTDWGLLRQLISRGGNLYARLILGLPLADMTGGFRCYRRRALEAIALERIRSNGYAFQIEMAYRVHQAGLRVGEIPIIFPDRRVGASKMNRHIVVEALINVVRLRLGRL